jgi:hypothetical protein
MEQVALEVEWALFGKEATSDKESRTLRSSIGVFGPEEFARTVRRYFPDDPPDDSRPGTNALPWLTFTPHGSTADPYLGLSETTLSLDKDGAGRQIAVTRFFSIRFKDIAKHSIGYSQLARALTSLHLPDSSGPPLTAWVPEDSVQYLLQQVEQFEFEQVARVASALLEGSLVITSYGRLAMQQRIGYLDALATLLPFGIRAALVAGSWLGRGGKSRLAFAALARENQRAVPWGTVPELGDGVAAEYWRYLRSLHKRLTTRGLVEQLLREVCPIDFDEAEPAGVGRRSVALERLRRIHKPITVAQDARSDRAELADVRQVLMDNSHWQDGMPLLSHDDVRDLVGFLTRHAEAKDATLLREHWDADRWNDLVMAAQEGILDVTGQDRLDRCLDLANAHGYGDRLLTQLLDAAATVSANYVEEARAAAIQFIRRQIAKGSPTALPELRKRLLKEGGVLACDLILAEIEDASPSMAVFTRVDRVVHWLCNGLPVTDVPAILQPLQQVVTNRTITPAALSGLLDVHPRLARGILLLGPADDGTLLCVSDWLWTTAHKLPREDCTKWRLALRKLSTAGAGTDRNALLDLVALVLGEEGIRPLEEQLRSAGSHEYRLAFGRHFLKSPREVRTIVTTRLLACVGLALSRELRYTDGVLALVDQLIEDVDDEHVVEQSLRELAGAHSEMVALLQGRPRLLHLLTSTHVGPQIGSEARRASRLSSKSSEERLVQECLNLMRDHADPGASARTVLAALRDSQRLTSPAEADRLMQRIQIAGQLAGMDTENNWSLYARLVSGALDGELGPEFAAQLRGYFDAHLISEGERLSRLASLLRTRSRLPFVQRVGLALNLGRKQR